MTAGLYGDAFFDAQEEEVLQSARVVVPILIDLVAPSAVLDVGCGRGAWLSVFHELGVERVAGVDGRHVNQSRLLIDEQSFRAVDLARPTRNWGTFDLALCIEVVEHLPPAAGSQIVSGLTAAAPIVLFSAAIPGQGGTGHVNERWPRYWEDLFSENGFVRIDAVRRRICYDARVKWWYRQNLVLYASSDALSRLPEVRLERELTSTAALEWVHVKAYERNLLQTATLRGLLGLAPGAARALLAGKAFRGPNDPA